LIDRGDRKKKRSPVALIFGGAGTRIFKALSTIVVIAVPTAGVWAGSSLAAYLNGPIWLAVLSGVLLFPGLPLAWEGLSILIARRRKKPPRQILNFYDRLIVRTFVLNLVFLTVFLLLYPKPVFAALTTRGDWMVDDVEGAEPIGAALLAVADQLSWVWDLAHDNPYDDFDDDDDVLPEPVPPSDAPDAPEPEPDADPEAPDHSWPFASTLHPLVEDFPAEHEASIQSVGLYLAANERDPFQLAKAVHDFVANRVVYDSVALAEGRYPPQDPETVFAERIGVCAGYSRLVREIGQVAGLEVVYVVGDARVGTETEPTGEGHAWNAVQLEGRWYLMDSTWAAGSSDGQQFEKRYSSETFLAPPEIFGIQHFPEEPRWQLRAVPLTRGEFNRQPMLRAGFFMHGFTLRAPQRSQVDTTSDFTARVENGGDYFFMARVRPRVGGPSVDCIYDQGRDIAVRCPLRHRGTYTVLFFDGPERYGSYRSNGSIVVNRR